MVAPIIAAGRFSSQIRGYRLELAEVETVLLEHAAVKQVVVAARNDRQGSAQLVAYGDCRWQTYSRSWRITGFCPTEIA
jgi:hypothetical protein